MRTRLLIAALATGVLQGAGLFAGPPVTALAISPDEQLLVTGSTAGLLVRDVGDLSVVEALPTELEQISGAQFSPDGRYLAAIGGIPAESGIAEIYSFPQRTRLRTWNSAVDSLYGLDWMADSRSLAVAGLDGTAWLLSVETDNDRQWNPGHSRPLTAVRWLPSLKDSRQAPLAVTASIDQTVRVLDTSSGESIRTLHNHTGPIHALAVRPATGEGLPVVASASDDRSVRFWQPTIGRMMRFARLDSIPLCLTWSSDGSQLVAGCADGAIRVIDPDTAEITQALAVTSGRILCMASLRQDTAVIIGTHEGALERVVIPTR